ncbi:MAG: hypothetical protein GXZ18_03945 [Synergistaceae bacterium]|nr:hypothetical protein [Synergistaceae bacterium]
MIQLKGRKAGLLRCIIPSDISERQLLDEFADTIEKGGKVLLGNNVVIDMQERVFTPSLVVKIWKCFVEPSGCKVVSWYCADESSSKCLSDLGIKMEDEASKVPILSEKNSINGIEPGIFYTGNLRGGQKLIHSGDVTILGRVHVGAEVHAKGHVVVLGKLSGLVHAGCEGDNSVSVIAYSLESSQVRIGTKAGMIDKSSDFWSRPAVITVCKNEVLITGWPSK